MKSYKKISFIVTLLSTALVTGCGGSSPAIDLSSSTSAIAIVADLPYGTSITDTVQFQQLPSFISKLNADTSLSAVLHVGDIHSGKEPCT